MSVPDSGGDDSVELGGAQHSSGESYGHELPSGAQNSNGESYGYELPPGSMLLLEDHISAELTLLQGDTLQGPSVHSHNTGKSDSFKGTHTSDATESLIGWIRKVSTNELLSPISSPRGQPNHSGFGTDLDTSGTHLITHIEQPEIRQRVRAERPGFKSPSLRIGSRGRTFRRDSDPTSSIPVMQKTLPLPACSAARVAPPPLVDLQTRRVTPSAARRKLARQLEQCLGGNVLDTQSLRRLLREASEDALTEISRGDLCMRHMLRCLGHCDALLREISACAGQARKLPVAMRHLRNDQDASMAAARQLLRRAVGLETLHNRLMQSLLKAFTNLGVGANACCSLGHGMDRVPLPSLVGLEAPCARCQRSPDELLRAAGQEAPFEPWWKCRICAAKGRSFLFCAECGQCVQASAGEALLSKSAPTKSWHSSMYVLRQLLSPWQDSRSPSATGSGSGCDRLTAEDIIESAELAEGRQASGGTEFLGQTGLPSESSGNEEMSSSEPAHTSYPTVPPCSPSRQDSAQVDEEMLMQAVPSLTGRPCAVPSATSESVLQDADQPLEHERQAADSPDVGPSVGDSDGQSASTGRFQFPATFLTCADDASVVSSVSVEEPSAEPPPGAGDTPPFTGLDLFAKMGDLWTPRPIVPPKEKSEKRWVLGMAKKPRVERRTFTKKLKLPVGPGLEKVILQMEQPSAAGAEMKRRPRVKELAESCRRDQEGCEADFRAKEILQRARKPPGPPPRRYAVAPEELFDGRLQAMDMPVWQGVVDNWNRRIRTAASDACAGDPADPPAHDALALENKDGGARPVSRSPDPQAAPELCRYRVLDSAQWEREAARKELWVDPDDVMRHYFAEARLSQPCVQHVL